MAIVPVATTANIEYSPRETLNPANRNVVSEGIGMQALSATISRKIPGSPIASTTSTANSHDRVGQGCEQDRRHGGSG